SSRGERLLKHDFQTADAGSRNEILRNRRTLSGFAWVRRTPACLGAPAFPFKPIPACESRACRCIRSCRGTYKLNKSLLGETILPLRQAVSGFFDVILSRLSAASVIFLSDAARYRA